MKPPRASVFDGVVAVELRGRRTPSTVLAIDERDHFLRVAADRFCVGMSDRAAATMLRTKLARYQTGAWRRDRVEALCPTRHRSRIDELLWCVLRVRDYVPSERTIRAALAQAGVDRG